MLYQQKQRLFEINKKSVGNLSGIGSIFFFPQLNQLSRSTLNLQNFFFMFILVFLFSHISYVRVCKRFDHNVSGSLVRVLEKEKQKQDIVTKFCYFHSGISDIYYKPLTIFANAVFLYIQIKAYGRNPTLACMELWSVILLKLFH